MLKHPKHPISEAPKDAQQRPNFCNQFLFQIVLFFKQSIKSPSSFCLNQPIYCQLCSWSEQDQFCWPNGPGMKCGGSVSMVIVTYTGPLGALALSILLHCDRAHPPSGAPNIFELSPQVGLKARFRTRPKTRPERGQKTALEALRFKKQWTIKQYKECRGAARQQSLPVICICCN